MKEKIIEFYHKYDYNINANFIIEAIIQTFFIFFILILVFIIGHKEVKADSVIVTPVKPNIQIVLNNSLQASYPGVSKKINNINTWTYKNSFMAGDFTFSGVSFNYTNANLCPGNDITIKGTIQSTGNSYLSQFLRLGTGHIFMDSNTSHTVCSFNISNNYNDLIDFTCTGQGGGNISIYYQGPPYQPSPGSENALQTIYLGISQQFNVTCNKSNADIGQDIINNNNNNTQTIINNNNNNTNQIINNQNQNADKINDSINDVNNSITDSSTDNPSSSFDSFNDKIATNGVITNLITLPITLFTNVLNNINGSCKTFNIGNLFGSNLSFPCIDLSNYFGSTLWSVIDVLFSGFFVLIIAKKMIKVFENFSSMREGDVLND